MLIGKPIVDLNAHLNMSMIVFSLRLIENDDELNFHIIFLMRRV